MGGDHHGDHGHHKVKIPDYTIYKLEDAPQLIKVRDALAKRGLKDPWLRNEVWRYHPDLGTKAERMRMLVFRGNAFKYGFGLFVLSVLGEHVYSYFKPPVHHGHH